MSPEYLEIPVEKAGIKRLNSGQLFEEKAKSILQALGFSRIRDAKESESYDLTALTPENKEAVIEVKGININKNVENTWYSIQYEKLWNLISIDKKEIYFLFLTNTDAKLLPFEQLTKGYFDTHRVRLTVRKGSKLAHDILRNQLQNIVDDFEAAKKGVV